MLLLRKIIIITACVILGIGVIGFLGLQIKPKSFPVYPEKQQDIGSIVLPEGLPEPVDRFYRTLYGDEIPVIETVVIQGRATMKPFLNIPIPARYVFVHNTGKDYRHYFEATLFGIPLLKIDEGYIDSESFFESPMANNYNEEKMNQGANLALWAEAIWFPSVWITDLNTHWEPVDENTALLYVPFEDNEETLIVRFNPETGLIDSIEAMRYRDIGEDSPKILWICRNDKSEQNQTDFISVGSAMWLDQGKPWAYFYTEELAFNVDISSFLNQRGR
ncbi:hypothetical protein JR338_05715 [Chloroflexota bacterium]|nr:hypothetical protein JR338_05715 [Chloroflexota bacterium]